jgi:hypothetical protein
MDNDFAGSGDALLTEPLRAFRAWTLDLEVRPVGGVPETEWTDWYRRVSDVASRGQQLGSITTESPAPLVPEALPPGLEPLLISGTSDYLSAVTLYPVTQPQGGPWGLTKEATCLHHASHRDRVPVQECTCGVYSWYRPDEASQEHTGVVVGAIDVLGQVLLGRRGVRSSRAKVVGLALNDELRELLPSVMEPSVVLAGLRRETRPGGRYPGVRVFDSERELYEALPPDLDTLANLLGPAATETLQFGGRLVYDAAVRGTGVQLVAGPRARSWGKTLAAKTLAAKLLRQRHGEADDE